MGLRVLLRPAEHRPGKAGAVGTTLAAAALLAAGIAVYATRARGVELFRTEPRGLDEFVYETPSVAWSVVPVVCAGPALLLGTTAALWCARKPWTLQGFRFARTAALIAALAGCGDTVLLLATGDPGWARREVSVALAVIKYSALLPAGLVALYGILVTWFRCAFGKAVTLEDSDGQECAPLTDRDPDPPGPPPSVPRAAERWRRGYQVPDVEPGAVGFCLSGGGIRAASIALGVVQSMRSRLLGARYLVSVSGGGFTAGALQQLLTETSAPPGAVRDPETAFAHGSVEEDFLRRHVGYLAATPAEMFTALGVLARGLLLSLAALFAPAVVAGVLAGRFYDFLPLTELPADARLAAPRAGVLLGLGTLALAALLVSLVGRALPHGGTATWVMRRLSGRLAVLMGLAAVLTIVLPVLGWLVEELLAQTSPGIRVGGPVGMVALAYLSALASILWRKRKTLNDAIHSARKGITAAIPNSLLQLLLVMLTTTVLGLAWLLLFVTMLGIGKTDAALWTAVGLGVVLGLFDQTSLSLHPFYRERLACTFAVRTIRRDGQEIVVLYPSAEGTTLSTYGKRPESFPEVIFAAAANLTGEARTPPGLNCVSYTLSANWVGGPDVGWVRTDKLERLVHNRLWRDLTVQSAVAVSGGAFASAMGRGAGWYQVLFAVSGARLGAWLPNPHFLLEASGQGWSYPGLPRARRLTYLVREVLGVHSYSDRLLHVTDGGHYDNLGLVELFRRRCAEIYCVDAGVNAPPGATSLADALTLAQQELGVRVEFDDPWRIEPGTAKPLDDDHPMSALDPRLAECPVLTGTIHYPEESGQRTTGRLVIGKAVLWRDLPYWLLSYAAHRPAFPHESTSDQFFDDGRFAAYTELGRRLGTAMAQVQGSKVELLETVDAPGVVPADHTGDPDRAGE